MWWSEAIQAVARQHGWPDGDMWHVDFGPRFGLFGPARVAVEVRDITSGALRGSFLFDEARRELVALRVGPRRFFPVWRLRRWAFGVYCLPLRLTAGLLLWVVGGLMRVSEALFCWSLRNARVDPEERERRLAELPPDVRARVARRCR